MVAIGFGDLQGLRGLQVPRELRAIKVTLALQVQQGRSAQQAQKVPRDPLDLLDLGGPRDLLVLLEIQQRHPGASNFVGAGGNRRFRNSAPQRIDAECQKATYAAQQIALYSITSSARASRLSGTVRPSAFAVLRLMTNSYLVGACTGRSAGFSPLRMRST